MKKSTGFYPGFDVDADVTGIVSQAGAILLSETSKGVGLPAAFSQALAPRRKPFAVHDPAKILLDQVLFLAMGGDALADVDRLRTQPGVFGPVASDPTVSRLIMGRRCPGRASRDQHRTRGSAIQSLGSGRSRLACALPQAPQSRWSWIWMRR